MSHLKVLGDDGDRPLLVLDHLHVLLELLLGFLEFSSWLSLLHRDMLFLTCLIGAV